LAEIFQLADTVTSHTGQTVLFKAAFTQDFTVTRTMHTWAAHFYIADLMAASWSTKGVYCTVLYSIVQY